MESTSFSLFFVIKLVTVKPSRCGDSANLKLGKPDMTISILTF